MIAADTPDAQLQTPSWRPHIYVLPAAASVAAMSNVESVKVAVRVRPFNGREKDQKSTCIVKVQSSPTYVCAALPTPMLLACR